MKPMLVTIIGIAAIAAPAAHAGADPTHLTPVQRLIRQEARGGHVLRPQAEQPSPIERIIAQETARRNDQALLGAGPVPTVQIVASGGFHWGDAGIGAAVVVAAMLVLAGTTLVLRARHPSRA